MRRLCAPRMLVDTVLFLILALPPAVAEMGQGMLEPPPPSPASTGPGARGSGQEPMMRHFEEIPPGLRERLLLCSIAARIVEAENTIAWESGDESVTMPGRPVALKLVGDNVVMALQFIPYLRQPARERGRGNDRAALGFLVAQGQIWVNKPDGGIHHQAVMQTIPFNFGEKIYFFPLGDKRNADESLIEIQLELTPYSRDISQDMRSPPPDEPPSTP